jgi:hypothetical protein
MNSVISKLLQRISPVWPRITLMGVALLLCLACAKGNNKEQKAAAASGSANAAALPANVDPRLLGRIRELAMSCTIDVRESKVDCKNGGLETLSEQFVQGARSQSKSLDTVAFALAQPDEKTFTVAAELLSMAFRAPIEEKNPKPTSKDTALSLINTLRRLPAQQAVDAAPATVYAALATGFEKELYAAIESHPYARLASRAYRYLMVTGSMRTWGKVMELAKSNQLEVTLAALDAPSLMREKTPEQRTQICDWYKTLVDDERSVVATRASGYLIVCGPAHIEQLLAADEERLKDKTLTKLPLGSYRQMCVAMLAASGPTPEQCARLKKLLTAVLQDTRFETHTRVNAIKLLTVNFIEKDVIALIKKYTNDKQPMIAETAAQSTKQLGNELAAAAGD